MALDVNPIKDPLILSLGNPAETEKYSEYADHQLKPTGAQEESIKRIEERLKAFEKGASFGNFDMKELSLVPDLVLPPKFKMPDFDKFDGTTCPISHLRMFSRAMSGHTNDEKLAIHCFQASLTGSAKRWYNQLSSAEIQTWRQLAQAFSEHYKHMHDMAPDRLSLQNMEKGAKETFRQYAQRWRDLASQVQPPLTEREITTLFVDTLCTPFYDNLVGNATRDFSDLIVAGEMIENAIKTGKIKEPDSRKVKEEVCMVGHDLRMKPPPQTGPQHNPPTGKRGRVSKEKPPIEPIPMSYTDLLPGLLRDNLITLIYSEPKKPTEGHDAAITCDYHVGSTGHSTEDCGALKRKVQELVQAGILKF